MKTLTERETLLTALVVVPAAYAWILLEQEWIALTLAAAMYLTAAHVVPAMIAHWRAHKHAYWALLRRVYGRIYAEILVRLARRA